jgi:hypothetical protein
VVADSARLLGPEHPETIACRRNSARWTGQAGDPQLAWHLAQQSSVALGTPCGVKILRG